MGKEHPLTNKILRNYLSDIVPEATIFDNPSFDNSIIGTSTSAIIYDFANMCAEMAKDDGITLEEAEEYITYNTLRTLPYMGENKPIIMYPIEEEYK